MAASIISADIEPIHDDIGTKRPTRHRASYAAQWADSDWNAGTRYVGKTENGEPLLTLCRRAVIPLPPRSYWQRLDACIDRPALPPAHRDVLLSG